MKLKDSLLRIIVTIFILADLFLSLHVSGLMILGLKYGGSMQIDLFDFTAILAIIRYILFFVILLLFIIGKKILRNSLLLIYVFISVIFNGIVAVFYIHGKDFSTRYFLHIVIILAGFFLLIYSVKKTVFFRKDVLEYK